MDIKLEKKKGWGALLRRKNLPYALGALFAALVGWGLLHESSSTLRIDAGLLRIAPVERGQFNDYVRLSGTVQPITTVQLSPLESGVVERIVKKTVLLVDVHILEFIYLVSCQIIVMIHGCLKKFFIRCGICRKFVCFAIVHNTPYPL